MKKIEKIVYRGEEIECSKKIANIFNENFCSHFTKENAKHKYKIQALNPSEKVPVDCINSIIVERKLAKIDENKACGPDQIQAKVLKECRTNLLKPLEKNFTSL